VITENGIDIVWGEDAVEIFLDPTLTDPVLIISGKFNISPQMGLAFLRKSANRHQVDLLPPSIEDDIGKNDPVRACNVFVDALDLSELGIDWHKNQVGNPEYDPKSMLKLLVYGYSYGMRSSRKLERAAHSFPFCCFEAN